MARAELVIRRLLGRSVEGSSSALLGECGHGFLAPVSHYGVHGSAFSRAGFRPPYPRQSSPLQIENVFENSTSSHLTGLGSLPSPSIAQDQQFTCTR